MKRPFLTALLSLFLLLFSNRLPAAEAGAPAASGSYFANPVFLLLLGFIVLLIIVIYALAQAVSAAGQFYKEKNFGKGKKILSVMILLVAGTSTARAEEVSAPVTFHDPNWWGIDPLTFWLLISVILFQLFIIYMLRAQLFHFMGVYERREAAKKVQPSLLERINASVDIEKEEEILFDHSYDGIRELDNNLPPWWKYGFYLTIIVAFAYLMNYHVLGTGDLQLEEYRKELVQADIQMKEYLKKASNLVDETNVKLLTDNTSLSTGRELFSANCVACHGNNGEGKVGPNLTDDYWLHEGGIRNIFKTIKFGYPEKGMKSWKDDFSPSQIACIASFVKSLHGSHPANPKEIQGELYFDSKDSMAVLHADTLKNDTIVAKDSLEKTHKK